MRRRPPTGHWVEAQGNVESAAASVWEVVNDASGPSGGAPGYRCLNHEVQKKAQKKGQEDMSEERCCGISGEHPYRDHRQCRTLKKLQVEVLTHLLLEGRGEGPHAFEPVLEYVVKLEKEIRSRDEEIAVVRALLAERPALQGRGHDEAQQPGMAVEPRNHECGGEVAAGKELGERPGRFREQDPAA